MASLKTGKEQLEQKLHGLQQEHESTQVMKEHLNLSVQPIIIRVLYVIKYLPPNNYYLFMGFCTSFVLSSGGP